METFSMKEMLLLVSFLLCLFCVCGVTDIHMLEARLWQVHCPQHVPTPVDSITVLGWENY